MITADPGTTFAANVSTGITGQVGTLSVQVVEPGSQRVVIPVTTVGVHEFPAGSGEYGVDLIAPLPPGLYAVVWDWSGGVPTPSTVSVEQLAVNFEEPEFPDWDPWGWGWLWGSPGAEVSTGTPGSNPIPTAADVRGASNLSFAEYGYAADAGPHGLQEIVDRAESAFYNISGQRLADIDPRYAPEVRRVIQGMVEYFVLSGSAENMDTLADWDLIQSFSAGPYSETRRSAQDMLTARMLFPVPWISQALWGLVSPDRYGYWMSFFTGFNQPAWSVSDTWWEAGQVWGELDGPPGLASWWGA